MTRARHRNLIRSKMATISLFVVFIWINVITNSEAGLPPSWFTTSEEVQQHPNLTLGKECCNDWSGYCLRCRHNGRCVHCQEGQHCVGKLHAETCQKQDLSDEGETCGMLVPGKTYQECKPGLRCDEVNSAGPSGTCVTKEGSTLEKRCCTDYSHRCSRCHEAGKCVQCQEGQFCGWSKFKGTICMRDKPYVDNRVTDPNPHMCGKPCATHEDCKDEDHGDRHLCSACYTKGYCGPLTKRTWE